jgi:N-methylhydantoinase B
MSLDRVTLTVLERKLDGIAREMGVIMRRAARSPIFSQSHDFSCFIADGQGRLISIAEGIPIHTGGGGFALKALLSYWGRDIHPGDIFLSNDPFEAGGNHLPDWTVMHPIFKDGDLAAFTCNRAHQVDIGGGMPGTYNSNAVEIFDEGIRLPPVKIYDRGELRRDVWDLVALNTRAPKTVQGDLGAMVGSTRIGASRVSAILEEYGRASTLAYFDALLDYAERIMRSELQKIPDGRYVGVEEMNNDVFTRRPVKIMVTITIERGQLCVDFTGTDPQMRSFKNSSLANTHAAVYMALAGLVDPFAPKNDGMFRPIHIVAPRGTVANPDPPAPVTYSTVFPAIQIIHACWKALAQAIPDRVSAGWGAPAYPTMAGYREGESYVMYHWGGSPGAGAIKGRDGFEQIGSLNTLGGLTLPNMELYEQIYPVHFNRLELRVDGGGAGEFRGGTGVVYEVAVIKPAKWGFRGEGMYTPTGFGLAGGRPGREAIALMDPGTPRAREAPQYAIQELPPSVFHLESPGGGGWGDPLRRAPRSVERDVRNGVVSVEAARATYGVAIDEATGVVDAEATETRRRTLGREREVRQGACT